MALFHTERLTAASALHDKVVPTVKLPALLFDGASVIALTTFIERMMALEELCHNIASASGVCAERFPDDPGVYYNKQPGYVIDEIGIWAGRQMEAAISDVALVGDLGLVLIKHQHVFHFGSCPWLLRRIIRLCNTDTARAVIRTEPKTFSHFSEMEPVGPHLPTVHVAAHLVCRRPLLARSRPR